MRLERVVCLQSICKQIIFVPIVSIATYWTYFVDHARSISKNHTNKWWQNIYLFNFTQRTLTMQMQLNDGVWSVESAVLKLNDIANSFGRSVVKYVNGNCYGCRMTVWIRFNYFPAGGPGADPFLPIVIVFFFANILYRNRDNALEHLSTCNCDCIWIDLQVGIGGCGLSVRRHVNGKDQCDDHQYQQSKNRLHFSRILLAPKTIEWATVPIALRLW